MEGGRAPPAAPLRHGRPAQERERQVRAALGAQAAAAAERLAGSAPALATGPDDAGPPLPAGAGALVAELAALQGARQYAQGLQVGPEGLGLGLQGGQRVCLKGL